jgi:hypothetical protein
MSVTNTPVPSENPSSNNGSYFYSYSINLKAPKIKIDAHETYSTKTFEKTLYLNDVRGFYSGSSMKITNKYVNPKIVGKVSLKHKGRSITIQNSKIDSQYINLGDFLEFKGPIQKIEFVSNVKGGKTKDKINQRQTVQTVKWGAIKE